MSVEDLLKPRFKVIADYPNSCLRVGYIIDKPTPILYIQSYANGVSDMETFAQYPHLFKALKWWEDRTIENMPKYVKNEDGAVYKVIGYDTNMVLTVKDYKGINHFKAASMHLPSTEEDYIDYIKKFKP